MISCCPAAQKEVALLGSCVGVGELAVSDHRSSNPTGAELARIARCGNDGVTFAFYHTKVFVKFPLVPDLHGQQGAGNFFHSAGNQTASVLPSSAKLRMHVLHS